MQPAIEIKSVLKLAEGLHTPLHPNEIYQIVNIDGESKVVIAKFIPPPPMPSFSEALSEEEKLQEEAKELENEDEKERRKQLFEFKRKMQIRPGMFFFAGDKGLVELKDQPECYFETATSKKLLQVLRNFTKNNSKLSKYKKVKRSYLLHSDPGMGKSALIRYFCREALKSEGTCILKVSGELEFAILHNIFLMEYHKDVKSIILVIEDFGKKDYALNQNIYNPSCLNFLDGDIQLFRVPTMILTTTNFIKELGPQLTSRPGRFSMIINVAPPTNEEIFDLAESYLKRPLSKEEKDAFANKGFTPDYCLEAIIRSEIEEVPISEAIDQIIQERDWVNSK